MESAGDVNTTQENRSRAGPFGKAVPKHEQVSETSLHLPPATHLRGMEIARELTCHASTPHASQSAPEQKRGVIFPEVYFSDFPGHIFQASLPTSTPASHSKHPFLAAQ